MYPHESLIKKNEIVITDLPEKTQKSIAKFASETDEEKRDALDEKIFGDVQDFIEEKKKQEKMAKTKADREAEKAELEKEKSKKKGPDLSAAPTAAPAASTETPAPAAPKERRFMDSVLGRK